MHAAQHRAVLALKDNANSVFVLDRIGDRIVRLWPAVASLLLGIPYPIGAWRLHPRHLSHCYDALYCMAGPKEKGHSARWLPRLSQLYHPSLEDPEGRDLPSMTIIRELEDGARKTKRKKTKGTSGWRKTSL